MAFVNRYKSMLIDYNFGDTRCTQEDVTSTKQTIDYNKGWDQNNDIDFWNRPHNYTNRLSTVSNNTEGYKGVCNALLMDSCNQNNRLGLCNLDYNNSDKMHLDVYNKNGSKKSLYKNIN